MSSLRISELNAHIQDYDQIQQPAIQKSGAECASTGLVECFNIKCVHFFKYFFAIPWWFGLQLRIMNLKMLVTQMLSG